MPIFRKAQRAFAQDFPKQVKTVKLNFNVKSLAKRREINLKVITDKLDYLSAPSG